MLKNIPVQTVLSIRQIIPDGAAVAGLFMETAPLLGANQIEVIGTPMTIFHDGEFKLIDLDVEVIYPVAKNVKHNIPLADDRALSTRTLEAIPQAASIIHKGDYARFAETYELIGHWIESNQYQISGVVREIYLRPPGEEQALTEIQFPIERIK